MLFSWRVKNLPKIGIVFILILLTACSTRQTPAPVVDAQAQIPLSKRVKNSISGQQYTVKKGETLYSIAWRADVDVRTLATINKIKPPYRIFPGQKLLLDGRVLKASKNKQRNGLAIPTNEKPTKKPVAQPKKQEYGESVVAQKTNSDTAKKTQPFSQKIKKWVWPARGKVLANFSTAKQGNKGIDIAGNRGDSVNAAADGKVVYAGDVLRGYGKLVIVKHNDDYLSAYAHNDRILVKEQQTVKAGQVIAKMGDTDAKRVMLHFEVRFRGKSVNPRKYLPRR